MASGRRAGLDSVTQESRRAIRAGSKSFAAASALFGREVRERAWDLYAWCRVCDDVIDGQVLGHAPEGPVLPERGTPAERLARLRELTHAALEDDGPLPLEFEALRRAARASAIPSAQAFALLDGFAMDVERRRYETLEQLLAYAYHVAGVVGVMMAAAMGVRDRGTLQRACDLGIAFQLTNIARDVMEDARAQRIYLPAAWLAAEGVPATPQAVLAPEHRAAVARTTGRLLAEAERYYASAGAGIARLPLRSAWAVAAARAVYRDIGRIVRRRGAGAWDTRAGASAARKLMLLLWSGATVLRLKLLRPTPPREGLWTMPASQ